MQIFEHSLNKQKSQSQLGKTYRIKILLVWQA